MKAATHIGFAELLYLLFFTTAGVALSGFNGLLVAVASVLPDIDNGASFIGRFFPPLTRVLERRFGHRTLTHSLAFVGFLALLSVGPLLAGCDVLACVLVGYASHPLLDTCTPNGVRLFYPFSEVRCVFPFDGNAPHRFRIASGSKMDSALGVLLFAACVPALYVADIGYERFIRVTQHSVESAVRDYENFSSSATVIASIAGRDQLSGDSVNGRFPVVGALNSHTLIIAGPDGRLHSVGRDFESEFSAESIVCTKGKPARTSVRNIDVSFQLLGVLAAQADSGGESFCFGEIATAEEVQVPAKPRCFNPVTGSGKRLRLNYARGEDLRELNLENVLAAGGIVTVKTVRPGGEAGTARHLPVNPSGGIILSYSVNPGEIIQCRKSKGDHVLQGDTLALRVVPAFFEEQIALNDQKLESLRAHDLAALYDLDRAIADASLAAKSDSMEFGNARELVGRGYSAAAALGKAELKWDRSKRTLEKLVASRALLAGRSVIELGRLRLAGVQLRARAVLHGRKSEILSPCNGALVDVRREPFNGKEKLIFLIRKSP